MSIRSRTQHLPLTPEHRRTLRAFTAVMAVLTAFMYFLIGFHVVTVVESTTDQSWGLFAALAYVLGAVLLIAVDRRIVWILGAMLQMFVIFTYFDLATQRTPAFEVWGVMIRMAQFLILIVLAYLSLRVPPQREAPNAKNR